MTRLGARLPQERVHSFILVVRMVTNHLVVDVLVNLQKGARATRRGRAGGLGRARLASVGVGSCLCRVGWAGGCLSGLGELLSGQLSRRVHRLPSVHRRSSRSRVPGSLKLPPAAPIACCSRYKRVSAWFWLVLCLCRSRARFRSRPWLASARRKIRPLIEHISGVPWSYAVILGAFELSKRTV